MNVRRFLLGALLSLATLPNLTIAKDVSQPSEAATAFARISDDPLLLYMALKQMPKGADLHNHLAGTPFAENYLEWAAADGMCVDPQTSDLAPSPCAKEQTVAAIAVDRPFVYGRLIDRLSARGWLQGVDSDEASGHTQFFSSFDRFFAVAVRHYAPTMMVALRDAAADRVVYLELMHNPLALSRYIASGAGQVDRSDLAAFYKAEQPRLGPMVAAARAELDQDEAEVREGLGCATDTPDPACRVATHYLASAMRAHEPEHVFRSLIGAFALADADPRYVGINIVMPEDWAPSLRDYDLHMAMIGYLASVYPKVRLTLHAGELAPGLVPPADMRDHIKKAIDAGAERIGHGTAIAYEDDAAGTLKRMARDGIAVEINLTSNAVILGVSGPDHPLNLYRRYGVPVTLSTDDQGVLRSNLTQEYVRAVREQGLGYEDLKQVSRAGLEYGFVPGESLWISGRVGTPVGDCAKSLETAACTALVARSEKARLQVALESELKRFEQILVGIAVGKGA
ncbi:adenosine deaminase family protein [Novosphingobium aquimarinum]|uniref:adenosine deaminase family protein n=1 Tax=Novosphingobium aquimarinum TaxID=2682494 RepID=UPI0012EBB5D9|nr:adenosine deaminase [Novosphingobium aquimarinum]